MNRANLHRRMTLIQHAAADYTTVLQIMAAAEAGRPLAEPQAQLAIYAITA